MSVLGDIKQDVATQLGATNGNVSVPKRDRAINRARRRFYSERKWSFCFSSASVTITTQEGPLPTDFNKKFDPESVYVYSGGVKYNFHKVEWADVDNYTTEYYVYAINKGADKIRVNQTVFATVMMDYYALPADAPIDTTQDNTEELAPDVEPIIALSIAYWWLGSERNDGMFDRFNDYYKNDLLPRAVQIDAANKPPRNINSVPNRSGYNNKGYNYVVKGYVGRR